MVFSYFSAAVLKMQNHILYEIGTENHKEIKMKIGGIEFDENERKINKIKYFIRENKEYP